MKNEKSEKQASSEIAQSRERFTQAAETLYDLFRSAPIPASINGADGKVAVFDREAQKYQARLILQQVWRAAERDTRERCAQLAEKAAREYGNSLAAIDSFGKPIGAIGNSPTVAMALLELAERIRGKE